MISFAEATRMEAVARTLGILGLLFVLAGADAATAQIDKLPHPDTTSGNFFGVAVDIDGDRALVGASGENACGEQSGAAYIFERDADTELWHQVARITSADCITGEFFGRSVALSGDRALVAASNEFFATESSNSAYLFERDTTGTWTHAATFRVEADEPEGAFAASVDLAGDRAVITTSGDPTGARYGGAAYVFEYDAATDTWIQAARLTGSKGLQAGIFGGRAALDGDRLVVASSTYFAYEPGSIYVFERAPTGAWEEVAHFGGIDDFFISLDIEDDRILVGESKKGHKDIGAATLFTRTASGTWERTATLKPPNAYDHGAFGSAVSLNGNRALVAGYDEQLGFDFNIDRVVYVFQYDPETTTWQKKSVVDIGEVAFGTSVDLHGALALIGCASEAEPGAAYIVRLR